MTDFRLSVAPMMDWTDRHCRYFHRLLAPDAVLYTEMVTTGAIIFGDADRHLRFSRQEHPVVLQLGGSDPDALSQSVKLADEYGYDEINLNCGCPSDRVQKGRFGACLMNEPSLVAACVTSMRQASPLPVTVKCRIGVDDCDDWNFLSRFIETVQAAGCERFVIHARKAWLKGLSPKENRDVPPLEYGIVTRAKECFPALKIEINGGLKTLDDIMTVRSLDGAMIGREAYQNPFRLSEINTALFNTPIVDRFETARCMIDYADAQAAEGVRVNSVTRHMTGLFNGLRGARAWRQALSDAHAEPSARYLLPVLEKMEETQNLAFAA